MAGCVEVRITGDRGYFGMLSVEPQRQKTGLGAGLIEQAEALALERGCRVMDLTYVNVREELPAFYERFGYRRTGTSPWERDEPTRFPVHFVNMSKELAPRAAAESRS
jgi:GNAT superfamily N-acetyltransferase